jgi:hypothetical protein
MADIIEWIEPHKKHLAKHIENGQERRRLLSTLGEAEKKVRLESLTFMEGELLYGSFRTTSLP